MPALDEFRTRINQLDEQLAEILGERTEICREVAVFKKANNIPMMQSGRVEEVKDKAAARGEGHRLHPDFMRALYTLIIDESCRIEDEIIDAPG